MTDTPPPAAPTPPPASPPPPPSGGGASLIDRAKNILTDPAAEWGRIDAETTSMGRIFTGYVLILAAIPPLAIFLSVTLFGGPFAGLLSGFFLRIALIFYVLNLGVVFALGMAIDALAANFGGTRSSIQGLKIAAYAHTPLWLTGVVLLLLVSAPGIFWIWLLAGFGWGAYLIWLGLPRLMRVPADKAQAYAGAAIGIWFVLLLIARFLSGALVGGPFG